MRHHQMEARPGGIRSRVGVVQRQRDRFGSILPESQEINWPSPEEELADRKVLLQHALDGDESAREYMRTELRMLYWQRGERRVI